MKTLLFAGLAGVLATAPGTALAATDSVAGDSVTTPLVDVTFASPIALEAASQGAKMGGGKMGGHKMGGMRRMGGHKMGGMRRMGKMGGHRKMHRMHRMSHKKMRRGGHRFRHGQHKGFRGGKWGHRKGYKRPHRGFRLPSFWVNSSFFIPNYSFYGLSQPSHGYGWSRYYDDAVLTDRRGVVYDTHHNVNWDRYQQGYNDGYRAGQATYDQSVFMSDDRVVAHPAHGHGGGATYQGDWNGSYQDDGSYQGDWQGTYRGSDGRVYEGQYSGTFVGDANVAPAGAGYAGGAPHWQSGGAHHGSGYEDDYAYLQRCRKSSGIGGALIGGAAGALIGDGIAGNKNELAGALIGGGLGALTGAALEQALDKCRKLEKKYRKRYSNRAPAPRYHAPAPQARHHYHHRAAPAAHRYHHGWQGYYYPAYYYPQPQVTTVVVQSAPVTTTTTTTTVEEEVIYTKHRAKKRWKPAPKRKWKPRVKPAPVKGCQQANCYYGDL